MNAIVNKSLLSVDKFIPEMLLKQSRFTDSASGPFTKYKEEMKEFKENLGGDLRNLSKQIR